MFFHSGVDESKTRIHEEHWLKKQYPMAKIQPAKADVKAEAAKYFVRTAAAEGGHLQVVGRLLTAKSGVNAKSG